MEEKYLIRDKISHWRRNLDPLWIKEKSHAATKRIMNMQEFKDAERISCYASFGNEISTRSLIKHAYSAGKTILLPLHKLDEGRSGHHRLDKLSFLDDPEIDLPFHRGKDDPRIKSAAHSRADLVIVPGMAFDQRGHRVGMGAGCYDRDILPNEPNALFIGLAFDEQIVDEIPNKKHDIPVHMIITPTRKIIPEK